MCYPSERDGAPAAQPDSRLAAVAGAVMRNRGVAMRNREQNRTATAVLQKQRQIRQQRGHRGCQIVSRRQRGQAEDAVWQRSKTQEPGREPDSQQ